MSTMMDPVATTSSAEGTVTDTGEPKTMEDGSGSDVLSEKDVVANVSHSGDTASERGEEDDDIDDIDDDDGNSSYCYESDYSYEYNDDDEEEEEEKYSVSGQVSPLNVNVNAGLKRKIEASSTETEPQQQLSKAKASKNPSSSGHGNLKTTGLDPEDRSSSSKPAAFWTSTPQSVNTNTCGTCQQEEHSPVLDCPMVAEWLEFARDNAAGIVSVDPRCIESCMQRRVQECVTRLRAMATEFDGNTLDHIYNASPELVAVELRRFRWNVNEWQEAVRLRANHEQRDIHLQQQQGENNNNNEVERAVVRRDIDRLGFDQGIMTEEQHNNMQNNNQNGNNRGPNQPYVNLAFEQAVQQLHEDHENFLRETMNQAQPPQATTTTATATAAVGERSTTETTNETPAAAHAATPPSPDASAAASAATTPTGTNKRGKARSIVNTLVKPLAMMMGLSDDSTKPAASENNQQEATNDNDDGNGWMCEICMDDEVDEEERLSMECGHEYCRDCWGQFIMAMLDETRAAGGILTIPGVCPHRLCRQKVTRRHVQDFAPQLLDMYDQMAMNSFVQGHGPMRWCPGPNCGRIVVRSRAGLFLHEIGYDSRFARCDGCQTRFCFECGDEAHVGRRCLRLDEQQQEALAADEQDREIEIERVNAAAMDDDLVNNTPPGLGRARPFGLLERRRARHAGAGAGALGLAAANVENTVANMEKKTNEKIRRCPACKIPVEKNGGCNHMTCKCGAHFCWLCMANTTGNHWNHYCGREPTLGDRADRDLARGRRNNNNNNDINNLLRRAVDMGRLHRMDMDYVAETVQIPEFACDPAVVQDVLQKRQELFRFAHYYNRYMAHGQGQCFAENQCECLAGRAIDFTKVSKLQNCTDTDFFNLANQRLVASRRMLKYTYCFLYYKLNGEKSSSAATTGGFEDSECPADNAISSSLPISLAFFLDHQERLERMTEQLSFLSENAVTRTDRKRVVDMITTVDRCMQSVMELSFEEHDGKPASG